MLSLPKLGGGVRRWPACLRPTVRAQSGTRPSPPAIAAVTRAAYKRWHLIEASHRRPSVSMNPLERTTGVIRWTRHRAPGAHERGPLGQHHSTSRGGAMIAKQDILDRSPSGACAGRSSRSTTLVAFLAALPLIRRGDRLVFKGTASRKSIQTYRFSRTLDFTLAPESPYDPPCFASFLEVDGSTHMTGIEFPRTREVATKGQAGPHDLPGEDRIGGRS